ncbi:MAG: hypothetical protein KY476_08170 [Planctomycetes bacterium]|nr:hypothetical protein [Planctomycetota bacterium]
MNRPLIIPLDTTPDAARVYFDTLRKLGPERRGAMVSSLSKSLRQRVEAGVRGRHPDYDEDAVRRAVARILLGEQLFAECFPGCTISP